MVFEEASMIRLELTGAQLEMLFIAIFIIQSIFAALFFHWVLKLGIKGINRKANWIATAIFFCGLLILTLFDVEFKYTILE